MVNAETFWTQVGFFNEATLPVQLMFLIVAVIVTYLVFLKPGEKTDMWIKVFFALAFTWNGVVFFLIYARNPISIYFGAPLFIILAVLFVVDIFKKRIKFSVPDAKWKKNLTILWVLLVFLYPLFGFPLGHIYPRMLTPIMPCPLTVFALVLVVAAIPMVDRIIYVLLLLWALAGLPKCLGVLDCYEDCILFAAGVYGFIFLVKDWKVISRYQRTA